MTSSPEPSAPAGYVAYDRPSPYLDLIGPLFQDATDPARVALRIDHRHTNSRGFLHAGVLVAVADVVMGHTARRAAPPGTRLVTASLTTDFPGSAQSGDWVCGTAAARRVGRRLAFTSCEFTVVDRSVLTATGVFAVATPRPTDDTTTTTT
ncbi:MAG: PaaI family thioesterase [Pseudonocardia sp.]|nr:PaaI family thioesterase [Pseudonocardia sp.]